MALVTPATIFCETASMSASVRVASVGCRRTAIAIDFLPAAHLRLGLGAGEDVEDGDGLDQRLVGGAGGAEHRFGLDAVVEDEGEVALDRLQVGDRERRAGGAAGLRERQRLEAGG